MCACCHVLEQGRIHIKANTQGFQFQWYGEFGSDYPLHKLQWLIDTGLGRACYAPSEMASSLAYYRGWISVLWGVSTFHSGQGLFRSLEINKRNLLEASAMFFLICAVSELRVLSSSKAETTMMAAKRQASLRAPHQNPGRRQTVFASDNSVHCIGKAPPERLIENCAKRRSTNCKLQIMLNPAA